VVHLGEVPTVRRGSPLKHGAVLALRFGAGEVESCEAASLAGHVISLVPPGVELRHRSRYTKTNFEFERVIKNWRT
jgi:hypothetical protein